MFTGIIEIMGTVTSLLSNDTSASGGDGWTLTVGGGASEILGDCHIGDSIAINGCCLTVTEFNRDSFKVGMAPETLRRTSLGELKVGDKVNLERAMAAGQRFGGHMVQGHVDDTATIIEITPEGNSLWFKLGLADVRLLPYIIPKGFIALDGTSLTVCEVNDAERWFTIMMIAHTQKWVVMPLKGVGSKVNVEVDMVGKYALKSVEGLVGAAFEGGPAAGDATARQTEVEGLVERIVRKVLAEKRLA